MLSRSSNLSYLLPIVASSSVSFALCVAMSVFLFREQSTSAITLGENISTQRACADLEESVTDLIVLLKDRVEGVAALNDRVLLHIETSRKYVNSPEEHALLDKIDSSFHNYLQIWSQLSNAPQPEHEGHVKKALQILEQETNVHTQTLNQLNNEEIGHARQNHRTILRRLAWGLGAIGASGAFAGVFLGYGVARGLARSIQKLQVQVQAAAGKLGYDLPPVELSITGDMDHLDRQVQSLVGKVEHVVDRLHQREREVLRAEQLAAVGQLAAGMAHEIRNPLTSIKMLVQAGSEMGNSDGLPKEDLRIIETEVRRVERSLQTFLDFARPPKLAKTVGQLAKVVDRTLELTRGRVSKQHVRVHYTPPPEPLVVNADIDQMQQVLVNLVLNALDAMPGGGDLTIELQQEDSNVLMRVADTGVGIADEIRERIFEPFMSTKDTGLGLGLVISKRIVEDHGGTLRFESPLGGGAAFAVRLPTTDLPSRA
jgi:two-component system sensor histidine kinase HydH